MMPLDVPIPATPPAPVLPYSDRIRDQARALPEARRLGRGYDQGAVDELVQTACSMVDELSRQVRALQADLDQAWAELAARRDGLLPDHSMNGAAGELLMNLQNTAMQQSDEMMRVATEQGRLTVEMAQQEAQALLAQARAKAGALDGQSPTRAAAVEQLAALMLDYVERAGQAISNAHEQFQAELSRVTGPPDAARADDER